MNHWEGYEKHVVYLLLFATGFVDLFLPELMGWGEWGRLFLGSPALWGEELVYRL